MRIDRRTVLLGAAAAALTACTSKAGLVKPASGEAATPAKDATGAADPRAPRGTPDPKKLPASIAMVGDSITVLSEDALKSVLTGLGVLTVTINGEKNRRIEVGGKKPLPGLNVVKFIQASAPPDMWVIALGTNDAGSYSAESDYQGLIDDLLAAVPHDAPLVWMNVYRNDYLDACEQFNLLLRATLTKRGNATVGEWYQQVTASKEAILTHDGVHPNASGILVFANTIRTAVVGQLS
ncbi:MAG TPA: hypothetical protein VGM78_13760 [Ilumatobacteraceae bacterium]